jgi:PA14 domain
MMTNDLSTLIAQTKRGDTAATTALIMLFARDIRPFIATFATTSAMLEEVHTQTWLQVRRDLAQCPVADDMLPWIRQHALNILQHRIKDDSNAAIAAKDSLTHLITQDGLETIQALLTPHNDNAHFVRDQYDKLDEHLQIMVHRRYAGNISLDALASDLRLSGPAEVAIRLFTTRAQLFWRATAHDKQSPSDRLFPQVIEQYVAGTLTPEAKKQLSLSLLKDISRAAVFMHQVRLDLMLRAIFGSYDEQSAHTLAENMGKIQPKRQHNDSSILQITRPATTSSDASRGFNRNTSEHVTRNQQKSKSQPRSDSKRKFPSSGAHLTTTERQRKASSSLPIYLGGGIVLLGIILLFVLWGGNPAPSVSSHAAQTNAAHEQKLGLVLGFQRGYDIITNGKHRAGALGDSLYTGQGLTVSDGEATLEINSRARVVVAAQSSIQSFRQLADKTSVIQLERGTLSIHNTTTPILEIHALAGRVHFGAARGTVTTKNNLLSVTAANGAISLMRLDGSQSLTVPAGATASIKIGEAPTLDVSRHFVRGINLAGNPVTINGNKWLSQRQALASGLTYDAGVSPITTNLLKTTFPDLDHKIMLESGIHAAGKNVSLVQKLPNGDYDVTFWVNANSDDLTKKLTVLINEKIIPFDDRVQNHGSWMKIGPLTVSVNSQQMNINLDGLGRAYLSGIMWETEKTPPLALPNGVIITSPVDGASFYVNEKFSVQAEIIGEGTSLELFSEERLLASNLTTPYRTMIAIDKAGPITITAKITSPDAAPTVSLPLSLTIKADDRTEENSPSTSAPNTAPSAALNTGLAPPAIPRTRTPGQITFYCWKRIIDDELIAESVRQKNYTDLPPKASLTNTLFQAKDTNWGQNLIVRARGYLIAPQSGTYTFWVTGDNSVQLLLSPSEDPAGARVIAYADEPTKSVDNYGEFPSQKSALIPLIQGQRYFFEFRYRNRWGDSYGAVGWELPDKTLERPIQGKHIISE